jgi:hypothetical protein
MIIDYLKSCSFFILLAAFIHVICNFLESDFLIVFLSNNLITLLIALLAINTTTGSVVMTKLREIIERHSGDFSATLEQLKLSIIEQLIFIILAILILILLESKPTLLLNEFIKPVLEIGLIAVFIASLNNLYDTASSIFVILGWEGEK